MQVELVVTQYFLPTPQFALPLGRRLLLGRSPDADFVLPMRFISRRHAGVEWSGCAVHVEDYQSRNGVFINDRRLLDPGPHALSPGDVLGLAGVRLLLRACVRLDPDWLRRDHERIPRLVRRIEDEGDLDALPVLGDALEEVGCADEELLAHCHRRAHAPDCFVFRTLADHVVRAGRPRHGWDLPEGREGRVSLWPQTSLSDNV